MTTKINLPSSISSYPTAFVVAYVFATIDSKEYSWAITRSVFDSLPWAITDTSDGSDHSRDYSTRFEFAILNAIRSLHHIRIVKPSIYLVDPPIDFDMNWLHGYEFTILEIDPQGEITAKDVYLPTLYDSDEDDSDDSEEPVAVAEIIEPVAAEEVAPVATTKRLEILNASLAKKQAKLDARIAAQYARQAETNGQPLNDKRNGQSTMRALENGERAIFGQFDEIRKTEAAINRETAKITHCKNWMDEMPQIIKDMVASGEIVQWRKYPQYFFVTGVDKGRFSFQDGRVFGRYLSDIPADQYPLFQAATSKILRALKGDSEPVAEVTTQGEITESDVNFTDSAWDITPTPDGSNSGTPTNHTTLKSAVALHFNADKATKSEHAYYLAFWRKLAKSNSCTREICGQMVTITRLEKDDFAVSAQPVAPQPEMPAPAPIDWHTIIDDIALSDFALIDSSEWADHISEAEKEFDAMMETERAEMQCDDYEAEQAIGRKKSPPVPSFELLATKAPAKAKRAGRAKFVQKTGMLFDTPKVSTTDLIARRAAQRKQLGDRLPPAPLFRGI